MSKTFLFCFLALGLAYGGYVMAHRPAPVPAPAEPLAVVAPALPTSSPLDVSFDEAHHSMDEIDPERQPAGK